MAKKWTTRQVHGRRRRRPKKALLLWWEPKNPGRKKGRVSGHGVRGLAHRQTDASWLKTFLRW